jgi:hypothetical protein
VVARILADVYLDGGRNVRLPTTPGRSVQFSGGHAFIVDDRDMPHVLQMEGARVHPRPDAMAWAPQWLAHTDWIRAEVQWPEGYTVRHANRDDWEYRPPAYDEAPAYTAPTTTAPVEPVDMTDRQRSWIRPEDLVLEEPEAEPGPEQDPEPRKRSRK